MAGSEDRKDDDATAAPEGTGDFRGRFGYGRPAHGSDPAASYSFNRKPHTVPPAGAPSMPGPALEQRPASSELEEVILDSVVFRG